VFPKWLTEKKASREQAVVHELVHLLLAPLTEFYDDVIEPAKDGAKLAEYEGRNTSARSRASWWT
jgi:hypothetical protein